MSDDIKITFKKRELGVWQARNRRTGEVVDLREPVEIPISATRRTWPAQNRRTGEKFDI